MSPTRQLSLYCVRAVFTNFKSIKIYPSSGGNSAFGGTFSIARIAHFTFFCKRKPICWWGKSSMQFLSQNSLTSKLIMCTLSCTGNDVYSGNRYSRNDRYSRLKPPDDAILFTVSGITTIAEKNWRFWWKRSTFQSIFKGYKNLYVNKRPWKAPPFPIRLE